MQFTELISRLSLRFELVEVTFATWHHVREIQQSVTKLKLILTGLGKGGGRGRGGVGEVVEKMDPTFLAWTGRIFLFSSDQSFHLRKITQNSALKILPTC